MEGFASREQDETKWVPVAKSAIRFAGCGAEAAAFNEIFNNSAEKEHP
jgi:hypothetical protein